MTAGKKCTTSTDCSGTDSYCSSFAKTSAGTPASTDKACFPKGSSKVTSYTIDTSGMTSFAAFVNTVGAVSKAHPSSDCTKTFNKCLKYNTADATKSDICLA